MFVNGAVHHHQVLVVANHTWQQPDKLLSRGADCHTCVHGPLRRSSTNDCVDLVDEQDDAAVGVCHLLDDSLSPQNCDDSAGVLSDMSMVGVQLQ